MQKTKTAITLCAAAFMLASCGTIFPDKLWYPVDSDDPKKKEQKAEAPKPAPAAEQPKQAPQIEEQGAPPEEGDAVVFGEAPKAKGQPSDTAPAAKPAETGSSPSSSGTKVPMPEKPEQLANPLAMIMPAPDQKTVPPPPVEARENPLGVNALARTFGASYDQAWEKTIEVMLATPLIVIDKSSGVIITEWMVQQRAGGGIGAGLFSDGQRTIRYKYAVKLYDRGGNTEVVVIPYTQYTEGRQWLDGKPRRMISEHLMRLIVAKMEGK
ncbi:MAG: hypothetical protein HZA03_00725 [Nitrospinae bacterium]|nr:hypothetical protein [Nitrospinota bacterium]